VLAHESQSIDAKRMLRQTAGGVHGTGDIGTNTPVLRCVRWEASNEIQRDSELKCNQ
jgi:hypothetical protein